MPLWALLFFGVGFEVSEMFGRAWRVLTLHVWVCLVSPYGIIVA
jgi:hypothetical protein